MAASSALPAQLAATEGGRSAGRSAPCLLVTVAGLLAGETPSPWRALAAAR